MKDLRDLKDLNLVQGAGVLTRGAALLLEEEESPPKQTNDSQN